MNEITFSKYQEFKIAMDAEIKEAVQGFVMRCARGDAVPEQLLELAENFLAAQYGRK